MDEFIKSASTGAFIIRHGYANNPEICRNPDVQNGKVLNGGYMVCYTDTDLFDSLFGNYTVYNRSLPLCLMGRHDLDASGITDYQQNPYLDTRGGGVLLGFADTGVDYTQPAFRWEDGSTKIRYIWDQSLSGGADFDYKYGAEFNSGQINAALNSGDPYSIADHHDFNGHGTNLAAAAGSHEHGEYQGAAPDAGIIAVKLKQASAYCREAFLIPEYEEDVYETADLIQGVDYMIDRAAKLNMPIAICIGLGTNFSGHDGYDILEHYLAEVSNKNGVAICCAAGNEGIAAHHYRGVFPLHGAAPRRMEISVAEGCRSFLINIWNEANDSLSVSLESPGGEIIPRLPVRVDQSRQWNLLMEPSTVSISYMYPYNANMSQQAEVRVYDPSPGVWKLILYPDTVIIGIYDIWLPNNGLGGEKVTFLQPDPGYTVTMPGTSAGVITCAAYNWIGGRYSASSIGSNRQDLTLKPDISAPGENVSGLSGYMPITGTSPAAAIAAGACALLLQWGLVNGNSSSMNTYFLKALLIQGCDHDKNQVYPNLEWGFGRMNLYNTFVLMRPI